MCKSIVSIVFMSKTNSWVNVNGYIPKIVTVKEALQTVFVVCQLQRRFHFLKKKMANISEAALPIYPDMIQLKRVSHICCCIVQLVIMTHLKFLGSSL